MNKDFSKDKLFSMSLEKQIKILYDLSRFIETNHLPIDSSHFKKLSKYHLYLELSGFEKIQKLNKEFSKIKELNYQFQVYLMNLERFLGQSQKEYDFLVQTGDNLTAQKTFKIICLLDSIRSAHNVGAMFRNSECFGNEEIVLCGLSPTPKLAQVKKTAMGSDEMIKWSYERNPLKKVKELRAQGYTIWSVETSPQARAINTVEKLPTALVLIFGHEQNGISHELLKLSDDIISIPVFGRKNSLNVSISQGIVLSQLCCKL